MPAQYRAIWTVPGGGTGYSVFHFTDAGNGTAAQTIATNTRDFFVDVQSLLPDDVQINFDSEVLDLTDGGTLIAAWAVTPGAEVDGQSTAVFSRATGARVDWGTDVIVAGRRLAGRTYLVPISSGAFDTEGVLTSAVRTSLLTAANAFITDTGLNRPLRVWSRTHSTSSVVTDASVPAGGAILRGRRD